MLISAAGEKICVCLFNHVRSAYHAEKEICKLNSLKKVYILDEDPLQLTLSREDGRHRFNNMDLSQAAS